MLDQATLGDDDGVPVGPLVRSFPIVVPLFLPGVALSLLLGTLFAPRVARIMRTRQGVAWLLLVSIGVIVAATLTPQIGAFAIGARSSGICDLGRLGLAPLSAYLQPNETSANVVLFVPLGVALGLLPRGSRTYLGIATALAFPLIIEVTQLFFPVLERGCQSADVVDNVLGLVLGLVLGALSGSMLRRTGYQGRSP